ncbi:MAG: hypothetical protein QOJ71_970 [Actinomycetota bacterium]|jgi:uncharacterized protein (DUF2267 family)|nr:hypothetical protein [Actinomycetota bacterium]
MDDDEFISIVQRWTLLDRPAAERATSATLRTLADRLTPARARSLALHLPPEFFGWLYTATDPTPLDVDTLLRFVAGRAGVDIPTAERYARAVFRALRQALPPDECDLLRDELPEDIGALLDTRPVMPAEEFLQRVAKLANDDADTATRATEAVLETLGERIAPGEVRDLVARLPVQLHGPLRRGCDESGPESKRMPLKTFLERVAKRAGTTVDHALQETRAVLATLWAAVGEEYFDVRVQLPPEYGTVLPTGPARSSSASSSARGSQVAASRGAARTHGRGA